MLAPYPNLKLKFLSEKTLWELPSASGIAKEGNFYYIVGDNSPFLYRLDFHLEVFSKTVIHPVPDSPGSLIPKPVKPDFEAMEIIGEDILIFGSGSLSPYRDGLLKIPLSDLEAVTTYDLTEFYRELRNLEVMGSRELNVEALASFGEFLYLFNRDGNIIFSFIYTDLMAYLNGAQTFPVPRIDQFKLPEIRGREAGFSGATVFGNRPSILFTASVENTDNAYDDGEVYGSLVGLLPILETGLAKTYTAVPLSFPITPVKVESVTIDTIFSERELDLVLVTDSDGGDSLALRYKLTWDPPEN